MCSRLPEEHLNLLTCSGATRNLVIRILRHFLPFFNFFLILYDEPGSLDSGMQTIISKYIFESKDLTHNLILWLVSVAQLTSPGV